MMITMEPLDPERERMRLLQLYSGMVDEELEELAEDWESLTDAARLALKQELDHRGLSIVFEDELPAEDPECSDEFITIREFEGRQEAMLAKGLLESAGIAAVLVDALMTEVDWLSSAAYSPLQLRVKPEDAANALATLDEPAPGDPESEA